MAIWLSLSIVEKDDFFLNVNKDLHNRLLERKIDHDFITRPGAHTWTVLE